jgi:hypothetical protein
MSNKTALTEYANLAMLELAELEFVSGQLANDVKQAESKFIERNKKWPDLEPITNRPFNDAAFRLIGILQLCRAVDIYNWYCRESLKLALSSNPKSVVDEIGKQDSKIAKTIAKTQKQGKDAAVEIIKEFLSDRYKGDRIIRKAIHRDLGVMQNPEIELLCTCRNVLVHKRGCDEFGEIAEEIRKLGSGRATFGAQSFPLDHMPIAINGENYLIINEAVGHWAVELFEQQIFMMDQNFAHIYKLPRKIWERRHIGRKFVGN